MNKSIPPAYYEKREAERLQYQADCQIALLGAPNLTTIHRLETLAERIKKIEAEAAIKAEERRMRKQLKRRHCVWGRTA